MYIYYKVYNINRTFCFSKLNFVYILDCFLNGESFLIFCLGGFLFLQQYYYIQKDLKTLLSLIGTFPNSISVERKLKQKNLIETI
jgi:hypothetical protein